MNFFKNVTSFEFVGNRYKAFIFSGILISIAVLSLLFHGGLNWGIDFAGGTVIQLKFQKEFNMGSLRKAIKSLGIGDSSIQEMGDTDNHQVLIKVEKLAEEQEEGIVTLVTNKIKEATPGNTFEIMKAESVGPKVGHDLALNGFLAFISALGGILLYVTVRFDFQFGIGAIFALMHDMFIVLGFVAVTNKEFTLPILAAILTIAGYSVNDTIVVFDRIRENLRKCKKTEFSDVINLSINETLSRTVLTSLTTFIVTGVLALFGGMVIRDFALCLSAGVIIGTYSSIFVATPIVVEWQLRRKKKDHNAPAVSNRAKISGQEKNKKKAVTEKTNNRPKQAQKASKKQTLAVKSSNKKKQAASVDVSKKEDSLNEGHEAPKKTGKALSKAEAKAARKAKHAKKKSKGKKKKRQA